MSKATGQREKLKSLYAKRDDRFQAPGRWSKLPAFWFILFLSYRCTRRCDYCYSFNQMGKASPREMSDETLARLLDWIPEVWRLNDVKVNYVGFLGGEPLLRTDRVRQVMACVYAKTDGMQGALTTNADLVDSVRWEDLEHIQWMTTSVTDIDIDELARRMRVIKERSNVLGQTIAMTLDDRNLGRLLDITRFGIENGFRLRYQKNIFKGLDLDYQARILKEYHKLCDMLERYAVSGHDVHTTFLLDTLIPMWDLDESPYPCGKRLAVVFPDGSVGACIRDHACKGGTIFDPEPLRAIECEKFHYDLTRADTDPECLVCDCKNACQGGCPHDKTLMRGSRAGKSLACDMHRQIIPRLRHLEELKQRSAGSASGAGPAGHDAAG